MKNIIKLAILVTLTVFTSLSLAEQATYRVQPGAPNMVVFTSKATLESFKGKTSKVSGEITFDPENLSEPVTGYVTIETKSLDTGINLRNEHMHTNHLESEKYPEIKFELKQIKSDQTRLNKDSEIQLTIFGTFTLHGVSQTISVPLQVHSSSDGKGLKVSGSFSVALADYNISRPGFLFMKLAEEQLVNISLLLVKVEEK